MDVVYDAAKNYYRAAYAASICAVTIVIYLLYRHWYMRTYYSKFSDIGILGPNPLFFWGNFFYILWKGEEECYKEWIAKYGPVTGFYVGAYPVLLVADGEILNNIYEKSAKSFLIRRHKGLLLTSKLAGLPLGFFELDSVEEWKKMRQTVSPAFTNLKLKRISASIQQGCTKLLDKVNKEQLTNEWLNIESFFQSYVFDISTTFIFGQKIDVQKDKGLEFMKSIKEFGAIVHGKYLHFLWRLSFEYFLSDKLSMFIPLLNWLSPGKYSSDVRKVVHTINDMKQLSKQPQCILDLLMKAGNDESSNLSVWNDATISHCLNILMASFETTSVCLTVSSFLLATNPTAQDKLCAELDRYWLKKPDASVVDAAQAVPFLNWVVCETLRMYPITLRVARECTESVIISGTEFPKGTHVCIPYSILHHNKSVWGDPEVFRPERFSDQEMTEIHHKHFVPFGQGPRNCIGMKLALLEVQSALAVLLRDNRFATKSNSLPIDQSTFTLALKDPPLIRLQKRNHY